MKSYSQGRFLAEYFGYRTSGSLCNERQQQGLRDHSPNLDALRALAVCFVVASHLLIEHAFSSIGRYHTQSLGTLGVLIFFVHTCLVLMQSLERQRQAYSKRSIALGFLLARAFRIYPMSIVIVVLVVSIQWAFSNTAPSLFAFLSNVFLIQNLTGSPSVTPVLWSLPYEIQMYLFLPTLFTVASAEQSWFRIVALWCAFVALALLLWRFSMGFHLIKFVPCFLSGVLAYCLRNKPRSWPPFLLFCCVGVAAAIFPLLVGMGFSATVLSWIICPILGMIIPKCRELETGWLQRCGDTIARYSYSIYLVHVPILYLSFTYFDALPWCGAWALFIGGVAVASYLGYHYVEKPGIAYGRLLMDRINGIGTPRARNA